MNFKPLDSNVITIRQSARIECPEIDSATVIQTKVVGFWKTDGYDDQTPFPS